MDQPSDLTLSCLIHDLNNVFQTLVEAADLLSEDPRWAPVSAAILRSIERGREIGASLQNVNQPPVALERLVENAMVFVQDSVILSNGPQIRFECQVETGLVLRQPWAWERVLINLFTNSVRAMPNGGTVSVQARRVRRCVEIRVADDGQGIPQELLPNLFEPHVSSKATGGLGLHIVKTIVAEQEGEVRAANRPGKGAEFVITVPIEPAAARLATA